MQQQRPVPPDMHAVLPAPGAGNAARSAAPSNVGAPRSQPDGRPEGVAVLGVEFAEYIRLIQVFVPVRTVSSLNMREHYMARARRVKTERAAARLVLGPAFPEVDRIELLSRFPAVRLTRITGPRGRELDDDNLRGCLKAIRDGVADWLRIQDNDKRVVWFYTQRKGTVFGVDVEVFA